MSAAQQVVAAEVFCGLLLSMAGTAGWLRRPGPVGLFGVRTPATKASAAAWVVSQRAAAPWTLGAGTALVLVGCCALRWAWTLPALALMNAPAVGLVVCAVVRADRSARPLVPR